MPHHKKFFLFIYVFILFYFFLGGGTDGNKRKKNIKLHLFALVELNVRSNFLESFSQIDTFVIIGMPTPVGYTHTLKPMNVSNLLQVFGDPIKLTCPQPMVHTLKVQHLELCQFCELIETIAEIEDWTVGNRVERVCIRTISIVFTRGAVGEDFLWVPSNVENTELCKIGERAEEVVV